MKRTAKYVAFDVHQATTVASVREQSGRVIDRRVLPTEASVLSEYICSMRGSVHVVFEEGTQAQWLHEVLLPLADVPTPRSMVQSGSRAFRCSNGSQVMLRAQPIRVAAKASMPMRQA